MIVWRSSGTVDGARRQSLDMADLTQNETYVFPTMDKEQSWQMGFYLADCSTVLVDDVRRHRGNDIYYLAAGDGPLHSIAAFCGRQNQTWQPDTANSYRKITATGRLGWEDRVWHVSLRALFFRLHDHPFS